jgi:uncharacterized protein YcbX
VPDTNPIVSQIHVYPVKSLGGLALPESPVESRGLEHDRRWMLVDAAGRFLTQREWPRMALVSVALAPGGLLLSAPGVEPLRVPFEPKAPARRLTVQVWRSVCEAAPVGEEADGWFAEFLGVPCRLVYMPDETRRAVNPDHSAGEGIVSFADGYPLLLLGEASLADLNARLARPVTMDRFRPNLVVSGAPPYAEDGWKRVRIGGALFQAAKPCARCGLITVDQDAGEVSGSEPLRTLAAYRRRDGKVLFGQLLIPLEMGAVRVGDAVELP